MVPAISTPRRPPTGRRRGRPPGTTNAARLARQNALAAGFASEPPPKRRRYVPGGPGGGGRFVDPDSLDASDSIATSSAPRPRTAARELVNGVSPSLPLRRERSTRTRALAAEDPEEWGSAAAMAASVKQAEDYKPREERSWEEFHPNLDIDRDFMVFRAEDVDGPPQDTPLTPGQQSQVPGTPLNDSMTPLRHVNPASTGNTPNPQHRSETNPFDTYMGTPSRRPRRMTRDVVSFQSVRSTDLLSTPRTPKVLPIQNQTPKERLDLKQPSFRKTDRVELFERKAFGQARYVDKAMSNVGYQESDHFIRPERTLLKAVDGVFDDDADPTSTARHDDGTHPARTGRVEYDMDEQDDMWLERYNSQRRQNELEPIPREIFEITMTKIEKEWHALEKRIPKPNPKPPQTHRPRSSSAAAVNGEPQAGEEPDSKCVICDDGDCENTNAIVFCDGCNLAVHQECYGVPFIPEGQWLCRKCQLCGRGVPTCIFCPNTDGAFKQTNSSKWAHLLCAMWIPEVSLGNHTFMEPVMDVEKVPKNRWKLNCYICHQKMGACIQCGNKNCYQAFHVTCARRARLYLKMKTSQGQLAVLEGSMILKAFCDRHCPLEYALENQVHLATRSAKKFYKKNMRGRIWADNHAIANVIAARHRTAITEHPPDESQVTGAKNAAVLGDRNKGEPPKNVWRLPSGAPVIPQAVFDTVEASIQRFTFRKRKDYLGEACRYWTLKREARRGAALLKRLQLQMESFSSMELTRRNFASMGPSGKARLSRRVAFAETLIQDLEQLQALSNEIVERERTKLDAAELEEEFVDECYFPVAKLLGPAVEKAIALDKDIFTGGLAELQTPVEERFYVTTLSFAQGLHDVISKGIATAPPTSGQDQPRFELSDTSPSKHSFSDIRERRKLGKRILRAVQQPLDTAMRVEAGISHKSFEGMQKELDAIFEASLDVRQSEMKHDEDGEDAVMADVPDSSEITVKPVEDDEDAGIEDAGNSDTMVAGGGDGADEGESIEVNTTGLGIVNGDAPDDVDMADEAAPKSTMLQGVGASQTPPGAEGYTAIGRPRHAEPPTPPQSNGSLGKEPLDALVEGGIIWYLKTFEPKGTSVLAENWERETVRLMSEEFTDMDDEELKGLGADLDDSIAALPLVEADNVGIGTANTPKGKANKVRKRRTSGRRR